MADLAALIKKGIKPYIPLFSSRSGTSTPTLESGFVFDSEKDRYRCPEGQDLTPCEPATAYRRRYQVKANLCRKCPQVSTCIPNPTLRKQGRMIRRNNHQVLYEQMTLAMKTDSFITKLTERMWNREGIIAESKKLHGLDQAKYRGLQKVQIQAYMTATIQNIKRLVTKLFCSLKPFPSTLLRLENLLRTLFTPYNMFQSSFFNSPVPF